MTTYLLDANVLIALVVEEDEHHARASSRAATVTSFALCPVVAGALVRYLVRLGESPVTALRVLQLSTRYRPANSGRTPSPTSIPTRRRCVGIAR